MPSYDSRYRDAEELVVSYHTYDAIGNIEKDPVSEIQVVSHTVASYRMTTLPLPDPPRRKIMVKETESFPLLAKTIYNDSEKWWLVAEANPQIRHPLDLKMGDVISIP